MNWGINGSEFIVLILLAIIVLGPDKLPEYTRQFTAWLRKMRDMAEGAKTQFKEETGSDFDEIDWRKYDPRQYDPRRIIREALREPAAGGRPSAAQRAGITPVRGEDMHGGLSREDLADMDPRSIFRSSPAPSGSHAVGQVARDADGSVAAGGAAAVGGAAAAIMGSGGAEALVDDQDRSAAPAQELTTEPDPMELLGLAPAPFDVDAT
ncbi:Sec-independent protein translocase TatB [Micrococcus cohnii]|uniref:Sec-independent protein translocase protein TatB n=1 Tax=Micrococcus cohnii TaxID=993416 RepID=A0A7W7GNV9_9MICC|nr:Sec-independent protein translocase TatB [uncultured Micrococcus sp.]MBB4735569.1 sec-independent protein translocase protein TatB [Micrococcus cohnii]